MIGVARPTQLCWALWSSLSACIAVPALQSLLASRATPPCRRHGEGRDSFQWPLHPPADLQAVEEVAGTGSAPRSPRWPFYTLCSS